jgi:hypothetical protein
MEPHIFTFEQNIVWFKDGHFSMRTGKTTGSSSIATFAGMRRGGGSHYFSAGFERFEL